MQLFTLSSSRTRMESSFMISMHQCESSGWESSITNFPVNGLIEKFTQTGEEPKWS